jgi:hypothetical protein
MSISGRATLAELGSPSVAFVAATSCCLAWQRPTNPLPADRMSGSLAVGPSSPNSQGTCEPLRAPCPRQASGSCRASLSSLVPARVRTIHDFRPPAPMRSSNPVTRSSGYSACPFLGGFNAATRVSVNLAMLPIAPSWNETPSNISGHLDTLFPPGEMIPDALGSLLPRLLSLGALVRIQPCAPSFTNEGFKPFLVLPFGTPKGTGGSWAA